MPTRDAIPLHRKRQAALFERLNPRQNYVDQNKGMATHLIAGTGIRNDTCGHIHKSWFIYDDGEMYLQIPPEDECRKDTDGVCGICNKSDQPKPFYPKTPAGGGRKIHIGNEYYDYSSDKVRYFGLRDRVESYFAISPANSNEPPIGFDMIQANADNGASHGTINGWIRDVCVSAGISATERESRLRKELTPNTKKNEDGEKVIKKTVSEMIADHGTDNQGRKIPDVFAHDLRSSYCTQLCRVDDPNYSKLITFTGHKNEETLYRYVDFAASETDPKKDKKRF